MTDTELFPVVYSREDKVRELKRELAVRELVYGRAVDAKNMRQGLADWRIGVMRAILGDYERAAAPGDD